MILDYWYVKTTRILKKCLKKYLSCYDNYSLLSKAYNILYLVKEML